MEPKSAVSTLNELCEKTKCAPMVLNCTKVEGSGKVTLMNQEGNGNGASMVDAQEVAASNSMPKILELPEYRKLPKKDDAGESNEFIDPNPNMSELLRDYCESHHMPLPVIEIVEKSRGPNGTKFVARCKVASITRYGISDKEKDARQQAATEMLSVVSNDGDKLGTKGVELVGIGTAEDEASKQRQIWAKYRSIKQAEKLKNQKDTSQKPKLSDVPLRDRHNYFKNFPDALKLPALEILDPSNDKNYPDVKDRVFKVASALHLTPEISTIPTHGIKQMVMVDFDSEYDAVFIDFEPQIYSSIVEYFRVMLV